MAFLCPSCNKVIPVEKLDAPFRICRKCMAEKHPAGKIVKPKKVCLCGARK